MKPLYPIMAVLVIASVGAVPLRTLAADGDQQAPAPKVDPRDALAQVLTDASNRADAGKRIEEFLLTPAKGGFIGDSVDDITRANFGKDANAWTAKGNPNDVAALYFIIGPGADGPTWTKTGKNFASLAKHADWEGRLRNALTKNNPQTGGDWTGKVRKAPDVTAFLDEAVAKAKTIFTDRRTPDQIDASIGQNDAPPVVPDTARKPTARLEGASAEYTFEDIYKNGAKWGDVSGPKDENSRTISLKIYTKRLPTGETVNEIGVFDITDGSDIFGQRFPVGGPNQSFVLDDRTPGHKKYELKFETLPNGDRKIIFKRPDGTQSLETSVSDLYMRRADQAAAMGSIVKVGDEEFYVVPQGGAKGAVSMFPKSLIDSRADVKDARDLEPKLYAELVKRGSDGRAVNIQGKPMLGKVGDKDYHLEFNKALGMWEVVEGAGDPPPAPPAKPGGGGPNPGGGGPNPGGGGPNPGGGKSIADIEALLGPDCARNADDNKDLRSDLKDKFAITRCIGGPVIIIPLNQHAWSGSQQLSFPGNQRAKFLDHYLLLQFSGATQYQDVLKTNASGYILAGFVDTNEKTAGQFEDVIPFLDALKNYMGVTGADQGAFTAVPARVQAHAGNKPYRLTAAYILEGGKKSLRVNLATGGTTGMIWPKNEFTGGKPDETQAAYASLPGAANALDVVSSVDTELPGTLALEESRTANALAKKGDIAIYKSADADVKPEKYYIMFRFNALDKPDAAKPAVKTIFRSKHREVFGANNPLPASYDMQGLTADEPDRPSAVVVDRVVSDLRWVPGTTKDKGVLAVFQRKNLEGPNQKTKKENCVGPLIWWGLGSRADAVSACEKDEVK